MRYTALVHLAEIGGGRVIAALREALGDPEELIWAKADEILHMESAGAASREQ